jgi:GntR family transcriptional regulator
MVQKLEEGGGMAPRAQRTAPPYVQITDHFRQQILDGELAQGAKLPTVKEVAQEWGVATATASKAIGQLQVEHLVRTSPRGTFVEGQAKASTPRDRVQRVRRGGAFGSVGEVHEVTAAAVVEAPPYVADLFDLDAGGEVIRREWVTKDAGVPVTLSVSWFPSDLATIPEMLSTDPASVGALLPALEAHAGAIRHARDFYEGRGSDAREARLLDLPLGGPILAGTFLRWPGADPDRLLEYGEFVLPPKRVVSYDYDVS